MAHEDKLKSIIDEELSDFAHVIEISNLNINRCVRILNQSLKLQGLVSDKKIFIEYMNDILRASIVFLHSTMETTLREIIRIMLKDNGDLSNIPLGDASGFQNRKEKISIVELAKYHRGKTVDKLIEDSIDSYLSNLSFNNTTDITNSILKIGLSQDTLQQYYKGLAEMIEKRHRIVHEGDIRRRGKTVELELVTFNKVIGWIRNTSLFCSEIMRLAIHTKYLDRIIERLNSEKISSNIDTISNIITLSTETRFDKELL